MSFLFDITPAELQAIELSIKVAAYCALIITIPAIAIAWVLARKDFVGKSLLDGLVHIPMILPPVVPGFLLLTLFGKQGWLGAMLHQYLGISLAFTWLGAVLASAIMAFPLMVRSVRLSFSQIDQGLEQAASTLGASPSKTFMSISLPLALPGLLTGFILAFSRSLGEFGATITFVGNIEGETRTLPLAIYSYTQMPGGELIAMRLVILCVLISLLALVASNLCERWMLKRVGR
ncbi:MAG: molybdate ABC transporter permease subunit [Candidatus Methylopumilus sp.]|jgi:molybdate transport system permease protein|nr:molybdate ABC transporter permease subunit [Candidatus Methylopumilus sp.]NBW61054.1 molybdate ABC transporter permease subunit [Methylophilaceae bacterium]